MLGNFDQLAHGKARADALAIAQAGLEAIFTEPAVRRHVVYDSQADVLTVRGHVFDLVKVKRVFLVGFGKAAYDAVATLQSIIGGRVSCGFVIDLKAGDLGPIVCKVGTHPLPTVVNVEATQQLVEMLDTATEDDLVLMVVSGGGSSLLCYPESISCADEQALITHLTKRGATIQELNTVRKHVSRVKGGNLAKICYPATVVALIFSDVPGNSLDVIASGPTVYDTTTVTDAARILEHYELGDRLRSGQLRLVETPKDQRYFADVHNILLVTPQDALAAMVDAANRLGYWPKVWQEAYTGDAHSLGREALALVGPGEVVLAAGESTVHITGHGVGGRNQALSLAALPFVMERQVLLTIASDGHDNTDAAGAIADSLTAAHAATHGLDPVVYLAQNDSYTFFQATGDAVMLGHTGANVSDLLIVLQTR
jgi:glycerate-2-kinase